MNDIPSTARTARESLSKGLNALQSDPSVPPHVLELAGTIAQAMGALHQIERSNGAQLVPHAEVALTNVRTALSQLQAQPTAHPAIESAMEAVASSLGLVHSLNKLAGAPPAHAAPPVAQPAPVAAPAPAQPAWQPQPAAPAVPQAPAQPAWQPQAPPVAHAAPVQAAPAQWQPQPAAPPVPHAPAQAAPAQWQPQPQPAAVQGDPFARPAAPPVPLDSLHPPAPPMAGGMAIVDAALGTNSATNFYKGLSGNDIVEHGGLFIATYKILKVGTPIRLKVSLPGGYEFEANAMVRWTSEPSGGGEPGFGVQLTQISQEARQLIYRYARNREPLFHDDL